MVDLESLEQEAAKAKSAYRDNPTPKRKEAHRAAAQALSDARESVRRKRAGEED